MTLKHLRIYLEVYRFANITKAAEALFMTQPAVSRAIQEIEKYYGICLFERIHHRLYVTEAGKAFYTYALHIVDSFNQMESNLKHWDEYGTIKFGTSIAIGNSLLPSVLSQFKKMKPHLQVKAVVSNSKMLQEALLNNQLDFSVMEGGVIDPQLNAEVISHDYLVPVLPPDAPERNTVRPLHELTKNPLLLREKGSAGRSFVDHIFAVHHIAAEPILESISTHAILNAVSAGLGISFLPEQLVRSSIQSGTVATCQVSDESFERDNYLVWHKQKFLTGPSIELMDCFRKHSSRADSVPHT